MKKTYMLLISSLSLLCAAVERLFTYTIYLMNRLDPGTCTKESVLMNLIIHAFKSSDNKLCFPELSNDVNISTGLESTSVSLNHLTRVLSEGTLGYNFEVTVNERGGDPVYGVPMMGFGVKDAVAQLISTSDSARHTEPYDINDDSGGYGFITAMGHEAFELPDLSCFADVEESVSAFDYMFYGDKIKYISNNQVKTTTLGIADLEAELIKSNTYETPELSKVKATGKIDMGMFFPYVSPGVTFHIPEPKFSTEAIKFAESHPRSLISSISANHMLVNPQINQSSTTKTYLFETNEYDKQRDLIKEGVTNLLQFLETPYILHRLYNIFSSDSNHQYIISFIGGASTTLNLDQRHGESALMDILFECAGLTGGQSPEDIAAEMYDSAGTYWTNHYDDATNAIKEKNFNLWLSKRMAYNTFVMYMSEIMIRHHVKTYGGRGLIPYATLISEAVQGSTLYNVSRSYLKFDTGEPTVYNMTIKYSDSKELLSLGSNQIAFQPFHCYGLGSLLQVTGKEDFDNSTRASRRDEQRMVYITGSENIEASVHKLQLIDHLVPKEARLLPIGGDLDEGATRINPVGTFKGSWYNPNIGTDGNWYTNATALNRYSGADLNTRSQDVMELIMTQCGRSASDLNTVVEYCKNQSSYHTIDTALKNFIKTNAGMKAFSVPRDGNLTSKIWMIIEKTVIRRNR